MRKNFTMPPVSLFRPSSAHSLSLVNPPMTISMSTLAVRDDRHCGSSRSSELTRSSGECKHRRGGSKEQSQQDEDLHDLPEMRMTRQKEPL